MCICLGDAMYRSCGGDEMNGINQNESRSAACGGAVWLAQYSILQRKIQREKMDV